MDILLQFKRVLRGLSQGSPGSVAPETPAAPLGGVSAEEACYNDRPISYLGYCVWCGRETK